MFEGDAHNETRYVLLNSNVSLTCPFDKFDYIEWFKDTVFFNDHSTSVMLQNVSLIHQGSTIYNIYFNP